MSGVDPARIKAWQQLKKQEIYSGWLTKQGGRHKSWKKRWFSIRGCQILYFKEPSDVKPLGVITLAYPQDQVGNMTREVHAVLESEEPRKKHCFEIRGNHPSQRTFFCYAQNAKACENWIQVIRRVIYGPRGGGMFGTDLIQQVVTEGGTPTEPPVIVKKCVSSLLKNGLTEVGIFRLPGRAIRVKELKLLFDTGESPDLDNEPEVHAVASLLKLYLRELPAPLMTYEKYDAFISAVQCYQSSSVEGLILIQKLIRDMPCVNAHVLQYLCDFLYKVHEHEDVNKMCLSNLAVVFGPNFLVAKSADANCLMEHTSLVQTLTAVLIDKHKEVFALMPEPDAEAFAPFQLNMVAAPPSVHEDEILAESDSDDEERKQSQSTRRRSQVGAAVVLPRRPTAIASTAIDRALDRLPSMLTIDPLAELDCEPPSTEAQTVEQFREAWSQERRLRMALELQIDTQQAQMAELEAELRLQSSSRRRWETTAQHLAHLLPPEVGIAGSMGGASAEDEDDEYFNLLDVASGIGLEGVRQKSRGGCNVAESTPAV